MEGLSFRLTWLLEVHHRCKLVPAQGIHEKGPVSLGEEGAVLKAHAEKAAASRAAVGWRGARKRDVRVSERSSKQASEELAERAKRSTAGARILSSEVVGEEEGARGGEKVICA